MEKPRQSGNLSFPLTIEIMKATRGLDRIPVLDRYKDRPLQDIIPLVFVMYAVCQDVSLRFDEGRLDGPVAEGFGKGALLDELYGQTPLSQGRKCREAEELYNSLMSMGDGMPRAHLPEFLSWYILKRPGVAYSPLFPALLQEDLYRILASHNARNIYDCGSGLGLVTSAYDRWESYTAFDLGHVNMLFADLLRDLAGKREAFRASFNYLEEDHLIGRFDTVVVNALGRGLDAEDTAELFDQIFRLSHCRLAVMMLDYRFCVDARYEGIRRTVCEKGILEEVVEMNKNCFTSGAGRSAILVLNMVGKESAPVTFSRVSPSRVRGLEIGVTGNSLERCHFILDSSFYREDTWIYVDDSSLSPDVKTVPFGSLVGELVLTTYPCSAGFELCLTAEDYTRTHPSVLSPRAPHKTPPFCDLRRRYVEGSVVSILFTEEAPYYRVCRIESKAGYALPWYTFSFRPSASVDTAYVICLLFMSERLKNALGGIRDMIFESGLTPGLESLPLEYIADILFSYPVDVVLDKGRQAEIVRKVARSGEEVVKTDNEYGIIVVGSPLSDVERGNLWSWKLRVISETESVEGLDGILKADADGLKEVDAVFFDVNVESGGSGLSHLGLFKAMNVSGRVPLVVFSDASLDSFGPQEKSFYDLGRMNRKDDLFVFKDSENAVSNAVRDLRDRLDAQRSPDRAVMAKYSAELELAKMLDASGNLAANLIKAMRGEFEDAEDSKEVSERFGLLRQGAETVFNRAKERGILPPLTFLGAMQQFLADGEYFDNGTMRFYRLTEDVMPETLSYALGYFVTIVNAGSHANQEGKLDVIGYISRVARSTNIYRSCAFILMDLLKWYGGLKSDGPCYEETAPFQDDDLVRKTRNGNQDYWYIGSVHLKYIPGLAEGIPGKDIKFKRVSLEKYPAPSGVKNKIRYFLMEYRIDR